MRLSPSIRSNDVNQLLSGAERVVFGEATFFWEQDGYQSSA